jgi:hypothetical protein
MHRIIQGGDETKKYRLDGDRQVARDLRCKAWPGDYAWAIYAL